MRQVHKFAFDVSWVLVSSAVNLVLGFALRIILARWLGPFDLGLYTLVLTLQEFATLFAGLGMSVALTKYVAERKDNENRLSQIVFSAFTVTLIFAVVFALLLYLLAGVIADIFNTPQLAHLLRILSISLPFVVVNQSSLGLENGLRRMNYFAFQIMMRSVLMTAIIVLLVAMGFGVEGTVWGLVLSIAGTSVWGLYLARHYFHLAYHNFFKNAKEMVWFGIQILSTSTVNLMLSYTDIIMIGYLLTTKDVGYYGIAVSMCMLFTIIPQAVQRNTFPMTAEYWHKNDTAALQEMFDKSIKYTACILFPLSLLFIFFATEITTTIFGAEYIYSVSPFLISLIGRVLRGSTVNPVGSSFSGVGRPDVGLKVDSLSLLMNIPLNWLLIPRWGISGAAIATTISLLTGMMIYIQLLPRILHVKLDYKWYGSVTGLAGMAVAVNWLASKFINHYIVGGFLLVVYIILILTVFLTKEDRGIIKSLFGSINRRMRKSA